MFEWLKNVCHVVLFYENAFEIVVCEMVAFFQGEDEIYPSHFTTAAKRMVQQTIIHLTTNRYVCLGIPVYWRSVANKSKIWSKQFWIYKDCHFIFRMSVIS